MVQLKPPAKSISRFKGSEITAEMELKILCQHGGQQLLAAMLIVGQHADTVCARLYVYCLIFMYVYTFISGS